MSERPGTDPTLPDDVYASSRSRVPLIQREMLANEADRQRYDEAANDPRSLVGLRGPGGIRLYSPELSALARPLNQFLRFHSGLDRRLTEIAILMSAREMDQPFEWSAHERAARSEGVSEDVIDVVRYRRPTTGLGENEAAIIQLAREVFGAHRVSPATFATAQRLFGTEQLINICVLMGEYVTTGILLHAFDQQLPPGVETTLPIS